MEVYIEDLSSNKMQIIYNLFNRYGATIYLEESGKNLDFVLDKESSDTILNIGDIPICADPNIVKFTDPDYNEGEVILDMEKDDLRVFSSGEMVPSKLYKGLVDYEEWWKVAQNSKIYCKDEQECATASYLGCYIVNASEFPAIEYITYEEWLINENALCKEFFQDRS